MKYIEVRFNIVALKEQRQDAIDLLSAMAGEIGFESFIENDNGLIGYIQTADFSTEELDKIIAVFPIENARITYSCDKAEYEDWNRTWEEEGFEPIIVEDRCVIHDTLHKPTALYPLDITIDAHMAFGTGTHETTRMITAAIMKMNLKGKSVLDCGCGTGILSIVAKKCGAEHICGYDIDEWSVDNALHNTKINGINDYDVMHGDAGILLNANIITAASPFDIIIANINRNILLNDMPTFKKVLARNGTLIISGFYQSDEEILQNKAKELGLKLLAKKTENEWCCLSYSS